MLWVPDEGNLIFRFLLFLTFNGKYIRAVLTFLHSKNWCFHFNLGLMAHLCTCEALWSFCANPAQVQVLGTGLAKSEAYTKIGMTSQNKQKDFILLLRDSENIWWYLLFELICFDGKQILNSCWKNAGLSFVLVIVFVNTYALLTALIFSRRHNLWSSVF